MIHTILREALSGAEVYTLDDLEHYKSEKEIDKLVNFVSRGKLHHARWRHLPFLVQRLKDFLEQFT